MSYQLCIDSKENVIVKSKSNLPLHEAADEDPIATVV